MVKNLFMNAILKIATQNQRVQNFLFTDMNQRVDCLYKLHQLLNLIMLLNGR